MLQILQNTVILLPRGYEIISMKPKSITIIPLIKWQLDKSYILVKYFNFKSYPRGYCHVKGLFVCTSLNRNIQYNLCISFSSKHDNIYCSVKLSNIFRPNVIISTVLFHTIHSSTFSLQAPVNIFQNFNANHLSKISTVRYSHIFEVNTIAKNLNTKSLNSHN